MAAHDLQPDRYGCELDLKEFQGKARGTGFTQHFMRSVTAREGYCPPCCFHEIMRGKWHDTSPPIRFTSQIRADEPSGQHSQIRCSSGQVTNHRSYLTTSGLHANRKNPVSRNIQPPGEAIRVKMVSEGQVISGSIFEARCELKVALRRDNFNRTLRMMQSILSGHTRL
jgi:hypothetical protein